MDDRGYGRGLADLFALDPDRTHLNLGAFGAVPRPVLAAKQRWAERAEANPHRFHRHEAPQAVAAARRAAAAWLGVDDDSLALVSNVTEGVSTVLASLDLRAGDEVVLSNHGYGSIRLAAAWWQARRDVVVREVSIPLDAAGADIVEAFASAVGPRTRLVVVDQITSPTACCFPVADIAAAVRATGHDATVLVDGAHAPGTLPTDVAGLGADIWVGNFHKWMFAPRGTAGLWVAPHLRDRVRPLVLGWASGAPFPECFDVRGTQDLSGWMALPDALALWEELGGWDLVSHCSELVSAGQGCWRSHCAPPASTSTCRCCRSGRLPPCDCCRCLRGGCRRAGRRRTERPAECPGRGGQRRLLGRPRLAAALRPGPHHARRLPLPRRRASRGLQLSQGGLRNRHTRSAVALGERDFRCGRRQRCRRPRVSGRARPAGRRRRRSGTRTPARRGSAAGAGRSRRRRCRG